MCRDCCYISCVMLYCAPQQHRCILSFLLFEKLQVMLLSASLVRPSTTLCVCASPCMDAGEAPASARCLRLNIAPMSQTEWCHHWTDVLHNNRPPMWSLFQKTRLIRTNQLTGSVVRLGTAELLCVCWYACGCVFMCLCLHLLIAAPPSSRWQFACPQFSHSYWALGEASLHKHRATTHHRWICCMQKHSTKEHESCSNKHTGTCRRWGVTTAVSLFLLKARTRGVSLADTHQARYCALE